MRLVLFLDFGAMRLGLLFLALLFAPVGVEKAAFTRLGPLFLALFFAPLAHRQGCCQRFNGRFVL